MTINKKYEVQIQPTAAKDLRSLHAGMKKHAPEFADTWLNGVQNDIKALSDKPWLHGKAMEHTKTLGEDVLRAPAGMRGRTQCRVFFRIKQDRVEVLRIQASGQQHFPQHRRGGRRL